MISTFEFFVYFAVAAMLCVAVGGLVVKLYRNENFKIALVAIAGFIMLVEASGILH